MRGGPASAIEVGGEVSPEEKVTLAGARDQSPAVAPPAPEAVSATVTARSGSALSLTLTAATARPSAALYAACPKDTSTAGPPARVTVTVIAVSPTASATWWPGAPGVGVRGRVEDDRGVCVGRHRRHRDRGHAMADARGVALRGAAEGRGERDAVQRQGAQRRVREDRRSHYGERDGQRLQRRAPEVGLRVDGRAQLVGARGHRLPPLTREIEIGQ